MTTDSPKAPLTAPSVDPPAPGPSWSQVLRMLEAHVSRVAAGSGWLNIAPQPELKALLEEAAARGATAAATAGATTVGSAAAAAPARAQNAPPAVNAAPQAVPPQGAAARALPPLAAGAQAGAEARLAPSAPHPPRLAEIINAQPLRLAEDASGAAIAQAPSGAAASSAAGEARPPAPPPPREIATLESLRFQYRDCRACELCETRNRLVFGVGHDHPRLLFVGEGPGADEDAQGVPFVGRAGRLLTGLIAAMGLTRDDVYITNVVKCRPPGNRNPEAPEIAACSPLLERQIELLNPALIVSLGNVPLKVLNPNAGGITRERGRVFQYRQWEVLPTFHPSYLLRAPSALGTCWADFRQALERAYPDAG